MSLIRKEKLLDLLSKWALGEAPWNEPDSVLEYTAKDMKSKVYGTIQDAISAVEEQKVVDAVEVVRCQNCVKWHRHTEDGYSHNGYCEWLDVDMWDDGYCSEGVEADD